MGVTIEELFENIDARKLIPRKPGIYIVKVPEGMVIKFKQDPDGFQETHHGVLPNIYEQVVNKWREIINNNADQTILYYGRSTNIHKRIMQYVNFGYKYKSYDNHAGGRAIWYITENRKLEFEYYETEDFIEEETKLIKEYEMKYGVKPLANAIEGESKK